MRPQPPLRDGRPPLPGIARTSSAGLTNSCSAGEEELAELIILENGKTYADAIGEVRYGAEFFRWFAEEAVRITGEIRTAPRGDKRIVVLPEPVGVSLMVTPWNFPSAMATRKIAPALAAGCTTILKPASDTPLSALAVADVLAEAGAPPGTVNVVVARGSSGVVDTMLEDPRVRKLSFTGSTEVGRILMAKAGRRILRTSMELGGNAPFVVFEDADLDAAVEGAMLSKMRVGGETCVAANRFYVQSAVAEQFTDRLTAAMSALQMGPGIDRSTQLGPMINPAAVEKIDSLVSRRGGRSGHGGAPAAALRPVPATSTGPPCCRRWRPTRRSSARRSSVRWRPW